MRKQQIRIASTVFLIFAVCSSAFAQSVAVVKVQLANFREGPDLESPVIAKIKRNEPLMLVRDSDFDGWYYVEYESQKGWIHKSTILVGESRLPETVTIVKEVPVIREKVIVKETQKFEECPEYLSFDKDHGVDLAYATGVVSLREEPSGVYVLQASRGDVFALLDRQPYDGWFNVIHIDTGNEGYVKGNNLNRRCSRQESAPIITERRSLANTLPELTVVNGTSEVLTLRVGKDKYRISPGATRTIVLEPGTFRVFASVPRAYPNYELKNFQRGVVYSIRYYLVS